MMRSLPQTAALTFLILVACGQTNSTNACGATGEPCCSATACNAGLVCQATTCSPLPGTDGGPLCTGATCITLFVGTWGVSGSGLLTEAHGNSLNSVQTTQGTTATPLAQYQITFAKGTDTDLVSLDNAGCMLKWSLSGSTASTVPGQSCVARGVTFVLGTGGVSLTPVDTTHLSGVGDATGLCNGQACSANGVGMLTRR